MKATGIVRRIDDLGRIVIPKALRNKIGIEEGDPLEYYIDKDKLVIKKYGVEVDEEEELTVAEHWYDVLEGAQIMELNDNYIIVKKDDKYYTLSIETDQGDCCGYAEVNTTLFYKKDSNRNPIITNVQIEEESDVRDGSTVTLTFFGESKALAAIACECGSGSGWHYGACVTIRCNPLDIDEIVCSW